MNSRLIYIFPVLLSCSGGSSDSHSAFSSFDSITHDGEERNFGIYVPESYDGSSDVPLVVNFHGGCMDAGSQLDEMDMRALSDEGNFILVYPEGTSESGQGSCLIWNSGPYVDLGDTKASADDLGFVRAMIDDITNTYTIDSNRIYATGFSNGGFMTYATACYLSDVFSAIAPIAAMMTEESLDPNSSNPCQSNQPMPVIHLHGSNDNDVPIESGEEAVTYWVERNNLTEVNRETEQNGNQGTIEYVSYSGETSVAVQYYKINGGSHVTFDDIDFQGSDSRQLIWNFFADQ